MSDDEARRLEKAFAEGDASAGAPLVAARIRHREGLLLVWHLDHNRHAESKRVVAEVDPILAAAPVVVETLKIETAFPAGRPTRASAISVPHVGDESMLSWAKALTSRPGTGSMLVIDLADETDHVVVHGRGPRKHCWLCDSEAPVVVVCHATDFLPQPMHPLAVEEDEETRALRFKRWQETGFPAPQFASIGQKCPCGADATYLVHDPRLVADLTRCDGCRRVELTIFQRWSQNVLSSNAWRDTVPCEVCGLPLRLRGSNSVWPDHNGWDGTRCTGSSRHRDTRTSPR